MPPGPGHRLEDANLKRTARRVGLRQGPFRGLGHPAERPWSAVADQETVSRGHVDPAHHPLPDTDVADDVDETGHHSNGQAPVDPESLLRVHFGSSGEREGVTVASAAGRPEARGAVESGMARFVAAPPVN